MWKKLVTVICLASTIKCQEITFEQQAALKMSDIETRRAKVISVYTSQDTTYQNIQRAINSIIANLPTSIVNDRQSEAFSLLDGVAALTLNTNEQGCFQDLATTKANILADARNTINTKLQPLTQDITKTCTQINVAIAKVNSVAAAARTKASMCGTIPAFKVSETVFKYCLDAAEVVFKTQENSSTEEQAALTTKINSSVPNILKYATEAVQRADKLLSEYVDKVKNCIKNATNVEVLNTLLPTVTILANNAFTDQVNNSPDNEAALSTARSQAQQSLSDAATKISDANAVKSVTVASATTNFTIYFATSKTGFDNAISQFTSSRTATCVNNIRNTVSNTINRAATQYVTCVSAISSATLANDLNQLQQSYSQSQSAEGGVTLQCVTKVDSLFIDSGITACRKEAQADIIADYKVVRIKASTLKEEANTVEDKTGKCMDIAVYPAVRLISKDKVAFESCIYKTTKIKYTIQIQ